MKKLFILSILILCCVMTACSANVEKTQTDLSQSTPTIQTTDKPTQPTTAPPTTEAPTTEKPTEPTTEKPTDPPTVPPTDPPQNTAWKQIYIDFLNTLDKNNYDGFKLVYINDDDIPELLAIAGSRIAPGYLCWVNNEELCQENVQMGWFYYYEKKNYFLTRSGFPPAGWDYIKQIDGKGTVTISHGETNTLTGQESYKWNDEELGSSDAYENALNSELNTSTAQTTDNLKSYTEICKQIRDF